MIRYALVCDREHAFDAWFRDSAAFEAQSADGDIHCALCGSPMVRKAVMAPAVKRTGGARDIIAAPAAAATEAAAVPGDAPLDENRFSAARAMIRDLHRRLKKDADDVGPRFPAEARKIHEGDSPSRSIYGTATGEEARSLLEDGIGVLPIPALPDEWN